MRYIKKLWLSIFLAFSALVLVACGNNQSAPKDTMSKIKERGVLVVGVKKDIPKFALLDQKSNTYEGFEIDVAKLLAKEILGDETKIKFEPVTAKTRGPLLDNGTLDMVIATFTITEQRKITYNFSTPYFKDHIGLLVLKNRGIQKFSDLNNKTIGVAQGATTHQILAEAAKEEGLNIKIQELPDYPSLKAALDAKRIDAFSVDKSILYGYVDNTNMILPDNFSAQEYGIVTRKDDEAFSKFVNDFVRDNKSLFTSLESKWGLK